MIKETIIGRILRELNEMGDSRTDAMGYLKAQSKQYTIHICKIMLWGNQSEEWLKDWSDEVFNYCTNVANEDLTRGRRLKEKDYLENFFYKNLEATWELESKIKSCRNYFEQKENYPEPNININPKELYDKYKLFVNQVKDMVVSNDMDYKKFLESCKVLVSESEW